MGEVFVCDAVRTPIGRFGGSLAKVRVDDLAADANQGPDGQAPEARLVAGRRGLLRLRQPGRRGQPQCRADGAAVGGPAGFGSRPDPQSPVRLGARRGRRRCARDSCRRNRSRHRRRRRIDDARPVRDGQGGGSLFALGGDFRYHHRLALHQPTDESAIWRRCDAGDRRERRRGISGVARRSGRVRHSLAATRRKSDRGGLLR